MNQLFILKLGGHWYKYLYQLILISDNEYKDSSLEEIEESSVACLTSTPIKVIF